MLRFATFASLGRRGEADSGARLPRSCDGGRLYYDGCACILINGTLVKQAAQFSLADVEVCWGGGCTHSHAERFTFCGSIHSHADRFIQVIVASVDLDDVTSFRGAIASMQEQMSAAQRKDTVHINFQLCNHQLTCVCGWPNLQR